MPTPRRFDRVPSFLSPPSTREQSVYTTIEEGSPQILSLADIMDIPLRLKIAQLLAIAPELPIQDLCNLLNGMKGNVEKARKSIFRQATPPTGLSAIPVDASPVKLEVEEVFQYHSARNDTLMVDDSDGDEEALLTKLELNDPDIWNDNDILSSPIPETRNSKQTRPSKTNTKAPPKPISSSRRANACPVVPTESFSVKPSRDDEVRPASLSGRAPHSVTYPTPSDAVATPVSEYRSSGVPEYSPSITLPKGLRSRNRRSNSIDNVFIISDTDGESDLDGLYEDSHRGADTEEDDAVDDLEMEDLREELQIDMSRPFGSSSDMMDDEEL
jgi:hypothetical protein